MRILMLNYEYPPLGGGASPIAKKLAEELVKLGNTVDFVTSSYNNLKRNEIIEGVHVYRVPCIRKRKEFSNTYEMLSYCISAIFYSLHLVRKNRYDINHTHFILPTGIVSYFLKKTMNLPFVITSHGSDVPNYNPDRFQLSHKLLFPLWKKIVKSSEYVISPSNSLKNLILSNININKKIKVIPYGFEYTNFNSREKQKKILLSSRLLERKGIQYFLEAIKDLDLDYEINILGDGPYKKKLIQKAKGVKSRVIFRGWLDNTSEEYKRLFEESSIFVFPSSQESFGVVLLEAMSARCVIITSNAGSCPEVVGDAAVFINPKDPDDIKTKLLEVIANETLREKLRKKARDRVKNKFNWRKIAEEYLNIYEEVISQSF